MLKLALIILAVSSVLFALKLIVAFVQFFILAKIGSGMIDLYAKIDSFFQRQEYVSFENNCSDLLNKGTPRCILDDPFPEFAERKQVVGK